MPKHWRIQLVGGPLDGVYHENLAVVMPDCIGLPHEGFMCWYQIVRVMRTPYTCTATFLSKEPLADSRR